MIEVASGEYNADMTKLAKAALKKYQKNALIRLIQEETIDRHGSVCGEFAQLINLNVCSS